VRIEGLLATKLLMLSLMVAAAVALLMLYCDRAISGLGDSNSGGVETLGVGTSYLADGKREKGRSLRQVVESIGCLA